MVSRGEQRGEQEEQGERAGGDAPRSTVAPAPHGAARALAAEHRPHLHHTSAASRFSRRHVNRPAPAARDSNGAGAAPARRGRRPRHRARSGAAVGAVSECVRPRAWLPPPPPSHALPTRVISRAPRPARWARSAATRSRRRSSPSRLAPQARSVRSGRGAKRRAAGAGPCAEVAVRLARRRAPAPPRSPRRVLRRRRGPCVWARSEATSSRRRTATVASPGRGADRRRVCWTGSDAMSSVSSGLCAP